MARITQQSSIRTTGVSIENEPIIKSDGAGEMMQWQPSDGAADGIYITEGGNAAKHFLEEKTQATAIQTVNDLVAIGAANVFLDHGLIIPNELSIAGFGNILSSEHYRVPLTTIRQPKFRMGMAAFDSMLKLITKKQVEPQRMIGDVLVRKSTGPAKRKKS